jgi:hypothetical protein
MALVHGGQPTPVGRPIGTSLQLSEVTVSDLPSGLNGWRQSGQVISGRSCA